MSSTYPSLNYRTYLKGNDYRSSIDSFILKTLRNLNLEIWNSEVKHHALHLRLLMCLFTFILTCMNVLDGKESPLYKQFFL